MDLLDIDYANMRLACIFELTNHTVSLYWRLKMDPTPSWDDILALDDLLLAVRSAISRYFQYFEKSGSPVEDSYLTKWLDSCSFADHYDDMEYFLKAHSSRV